MLSKIYYGVRLDLVDVEGCVHVMKERVARDQRAEFHRGVAAALEMISTYDMREQSEFVRLLDQLYNNNETEFFTVTRGGER